MVLEVALRTRTVVCGVHVVMNLAHFLLRFEYRVYFRLMLFLKLIPVFHLLATSKLFKHDHLVSPVLRTLGKQGFFLLILSRVDDVRPLLLVLGFEIAQKLVERFVT